MSLHKKELTHQDFFERDQNLRSFRRRMERQVISSKILPLMGPYRNQLMQRTKVDNFRQLQFEY